MTWATALGTLTLLAGVGLLVFAVWRQGRPDNVWVADFAALIGVALIGVVGIASALPS